MAMAGKVNTALLAACRRREWRRSASPGSMPTLSKRASARRCRLRTGKRQRSTTASSAMSWRSTSARHSEAARRRLRPDRGASLAADETGALLNVNADTIAAELAVALGAEKLLFAVAVPGILERADDPPLARFADRSRRPRRARPPRRAHRRHAAQVARRSAALSRRGVPRVHVIPFAARRRAPRRGLHQRGDRHLVVPRSPRVPPRPRAG